jgi:hypothetical protein
VKVAVAPGDSTCEAALDFVGALVFGQIGRLAEALTADGAFQGFQAGVNAHVHGWEMLSDLGCLRHC